MPRFFRLNTPASLSILFTLLSRSTVTVAPRLLFTNTFIITLVTIYATIFSLIAYVSWHMILLAFWCLYEHMPRPVHAKTLCRPVSLYANATIILLYASHAYAIFYWWHYYLAFTTYAIDAHFAILPYHHFPLFSSPSITNIIVHYSTIASMPSRHYAAITHYYHVTPLLISLSVFAIIAIIALRHFIINTIIVTPLCAIFLMSSH